MIKYTEFSVVCRTSSLFGYIFPDFEFIICISRSRQTLLTAYIVLSQLAPVLDTTCSMLGQVVTLQFCFSFAIYRKLRGPHL